MKERKKEKMFENNDERSKRLMTERKISVRKKTLRKTERKFENNDRRKESKEERALFKYLHSAKTVTCSYVYHSFIYLFS